MDPCPAKRIYLNGNYVGLSLSDSLPASINGDYTFYVFAESAMCLIETAGVSPVFVTGSFSSYFPDAAYEPGSTNIGLVFDISGASSCPGLTTSDLRQQATAISAVRTVPWTVLSFTMIDGELQECLYDTSEVARLSLPPSANAPNNHAWATAVESIASPYVKQRSMLVGQSRKTGCAGKKATAPALSTNLSLLP